MRLEKPATREVVGLWLCFHATIGFCAIACIRNDIDIFSGVSQGRKRLAITMHKLLIARSNDDDNHTFSCPIAMSKQG
jgi:hypothetical protein